MCKNVKYNLIPRPPKGVCITRRNCHYSGLHGNEKQKVENFLAKKQPYINKRYYLYQR